MKMNDALALFAFTCSACGLGSSPTVSGQIQGWNEGTGHVMQVTAGKATATGAIDAEGNFSVKLPDAADVAGSLSANFPTIFCWSGGDPADVSVTPSPASLQSTVATFTVDGNNSVFLGATDVMNSNGTFDLKVLYVFVDQNASVSGTYNCPDGTNATVNLSGLSQGWNTVPIAVSEGDGLYETNGPIPSAAQWSAAGISQ